MILQTTYILILIYARQPVSICPMGKNHDDGENEDEVAFREAMEGVEPIEDPRAAPYRKKTSSSSRRSAGRR